MPGVAAMVALAVALRGRRVAVAPLAVPLVVVGRGAGAALGAAGVARAALRRRLHGGLARPGRRSSVQMIIDVVFACCIYVIFLYSIVLNMHTILIVMCNTTIPIIWCRTREFPVAEYQLE